MLVSFNELGITLGFLLAFIINYLFVETADGWRIMFAFSSGMLISIFDIYMIYCRLLAAGGRGRGVEVCNHPPVLLLYRGGRFESY